MPEKTAGYSPAALFAAARRRKKPLLRLLQTLVELESPSDHKPSVDCCLGAIARHAVALGATVRHHKLRHAGDVLEARFAASGRRSPQNPILLLGHADTVWPLGTLARMPFRIANGKAYGPGIFDMKAGIALALIAIEILREQNMLLRPVTLLLTGDEETGSEASRPILESIARRSERVYVLEPAAGLEGACKTARKGVASYSLRITGTAAHSGLNFTDGHSAVHELAHQIRILEGWTDLRRGITINIGTIHGGTRSNVVAAEAHAEIDVRVFTARDLAAIDKKIQSLRPRDRRCVLSLEGGINRPPMERTPQTVALYRNAKSIAAQFDIALKETAAGGGSDGNFTSALGVPTLDGMGAVGEGAHASKESVVLRDLIPRAALLAALLCDAE